MRLKTKFAIYFVVGIFIPLIIVGLLSYYFASKEIKVSATFYLQETSIQAKHEIARKFISIEKDFIQYLEKLRDKKEEERLFYLKQYATTLGNVLAYINVVYKDSTYRIERRFGTTGSKVFLTSLHGQNPSMERVIKPDLGGFTMGLYDETTYGMRALLRVKLPYLLGEILKRYQIGGKMVPFITTAEGVVLYHPNPDFIGKRIESFQNYQNLLISLNLPNDLKLFLTEDLSTSTLPIKRALRITIIFTSIILLLSLIISYRVLGDIMETVKSLAVESKKLAEGKAVKPLFEKRDDELGDIARHINRVAIDIYDSAQLNAFNKLTAFITHDLKNLLAQMSLLLRNLEVHYEKPGFKEDAIFTLGATVKEMGKLINSLKPSGRSVERINLKGVIEEAIQRLNLIDLEGIELNTDIKDAYINGDKRELLSIFTNIISNSLDAMGKGGRLSISMRFNDNWIIVKIKDTGVGMTREFIEKKLFRPFSSTKESGLGLGLFQVRETMKAMGGKITVESKLGKGTEFTLFFKVSNE